MSDETRTPLERSLVTHAVPVRRRAAAAVSIALAVACLWGMGWGRVAFDCERVAPGADISCQVGLRHAWWHDDARLSLREPHISLVVVDSDDSSATELSIEDAATGATFRGTSAPDLVANGARALRACLADPAQLACAHAESNTGVVLLGAVVSTVLLELLYLFLSASRVVLVADGGRRELRVLRTVGPVPRRPATFAADRGFEIDVVEGSGEDRSWVVTLVIDGQERVPLGGHVTAERAAAMAAETRALIAWLTEGATGPAKAATSPAPRSAWVASAKLLRPGLVPVHEAESRSAQRALWTASGCCAVLAAFMGGIATLDIPGAWIVALGVGAALIAPMVGLVAHSRRRLAARAERALAVEQDGVSHAKEGRRVLVRWAEIATVKEHVWPGRYVFRDSSGGELFTIQAVTGDDVPMAKALIAAARAGTLPEEGSSARVELGAAIGWGFALLGGAGAVLFGLLFALIAGLGAPPPLAALAHRTGRVDGISPPDGGGTAQLHLESDDFAYYVVHDRERAEAVVAAVHVGDEVEIWHDRAERSFGPIGTIFQLRVGGRTVVDRDACAAAESAEAASTRRVSLPAAMAGAAVFLIAALVQYRASVVRVAA